MKMKKKTLIIELLLTFAVALIYASSILIDSSVISPPDFLILTYDGKSDLLLTLFSVQASISTISIAVVSIITGVASETIYGVSVSKYITSIKPKIFKHKTLIIASLVWIFLNYVFVSYNMFNCTIVSLGVSIGITIILVNNVAVIFKGHNYVKNEIIYYVKSNYNEELIYNLNNETIDAIEIGASLILKRNYQAYKAILELEIEKSSAHKVVVQESPIINQISNSICDIFEKIVRTKDAYKINEAVLFLCDIYDIANKNTVSPFYLHIWNNISRTYFNGIKFLSYDQLREDGACWRFRHKLYQNIANRTEDQLKECDLRMYSSWLCYALCSQTEKFSPDEIKEIKSRTYNSAYHSATHMTTSKSVNGVYLKEICLLQKYFIDSCDEQSINELYFEELSSSTNNYNCQTIYLVTLIYLYYLSTREPLIDGKDLQLCAKNILIKNHDINAYFFYHINILDTTKASYNYIQSLMRLWEYMDIKEAKCMIIDSVILDFFVFTALSDVWKEEELIKIVDILIPNGMFSIYTRYFPNENFEHLKANYRQFTEIFSNKFDEDSLNDKLLLLKSVLDKKYKIEEITEANDNPITEEMLWDFKEHCLQTAVPYATSQFATFAFKDNNSDGAALPIGENKDVTVLKTIVPSLLFKKEEFTSYFVDIIQQNIGICFLNTILSHVEYKKFSYKNRNKQQYLVDAVNDNSINVNLVIGDKNKRWNEDNKTLLSDTISNASQLRFPHMNNYYFVLDSSFIEFSIENFKVEFSDVELDELSDDIRKDDSGQIEFNITNQLFVPFEELELKEYLHNIKRKVKITADIKYRISKECVGAGISIIVD